MASVNPYTDSDGDGLSIEDENIMYASVSDSQSRSTNNTSEYK